MNFPRTLSIALLCLAVGSRGSAAERPNVVWVLSEDNSIHYLRHYGAPHGAMPHVEQMAAEGVTFDRAFSCAPVCSVARTTLMSGMLAPRIGFQYHRRSKPAHLPPGAELFPAYLREAGYYTTNNRKKDYNVVEGKVWDASSNKAHWRNRPQAEAPFFHMQSTAVSHESSLHFPASDMKRADALSVSPSDVELAPIYPDTPTFRYTHARYFDRVMMADKTVGKLLDQLREDGLLEDTFVFYFGDHGGVLPGSKGYIYERGLHVPLVVRVPENWRDKAPFEPGERSPGFVSFIDFGPTVLNLCRVELPDTLDGRPFLGPGISKRGVNARDTAFGYADRFDEKYDFCRSLRRGRFKYIRNYQAFYPDGLQNNYRYRQLAFAQWRELFRKGRLNDIQAAFFLPRPVEMLFDVEADPYETKNLADDTSHQPKLLELRAALQKEVRQIHDLSFLPESEMVREAIADGAAYGQRNADRIQRLADTADLSLLEFETAQAPLAEALRDKDPLVRYWALIACSCFGERARPLVDLAASRLRDDHPLVRVRAAEFLGQLGVAKDQVVAAIREVLATSEDPVEALITLNTVVYLEDGPQSFDFQLKAKDIRTAKDSQVQRRVDYLTRSRQ